MKKYILMFLAVAAAFVGCNDTPEPQGPTIKESIELMAESVTFQAVDAEPHRRDSDGRVHMIRRGHRDRIYVALLAFEHLAPVGIAANFGNVAAKLLEFGQSRIYQGGVYIAERDDLRPGGMELSPVVHSLSAGTYDSEAHLLPRRNYNGGFADEETA